MKTVEHLNPSMAPFCTSAHEVVCNCTSCTPKIALPLHFQYSLSTLETKKKKKNSLSLCLYELPLNFVVGL